MKHGKLSRTFILFLGAVGLLSFSLAPFGRQGRPHAKIPMPIIDLHTAWIPDSLPNFFNLVTDANAAFAAPLIRQAEEHISGKRYSEAKKALDMALPYFPEAPIYYAYARLARATENPVLGKKAVACYLQASGSYSDNMYNNCLIMSAHFSASAPGPIDSADIEGTIQSAVINGYSNADELLSDPYLAPYLKSKEVMEMIDFYGGDKLKYKKLFDEYAARYENMPQGKWHFLGRDAGVFISAASRKLDGKYDRFIPGIYEQRFSRLGPPNSYALWKKQLPGGQWMMLTASSRRMDDTLSTKLVMVHFFDAEGKAIAQGAQYNDEGYIEKDDNSSLSLNAGRIKPGLTRDLLITSNNFIMIREMDAIWERPYGGTGWRGNRVVRYEQVSAAYYRITPAGKLLPINENDFKRQAPGEEYYAFVNTAPAGSMGMR